MRNIRSLARKTLLLLTAFSLVSQPVSAQTAGTATRTAFPPHAATGARSARPLSRSTGSIRHLAAATGSTLLSEGFSANQTFNSWSSFGDACLTAGTAATPANSVPACGANAPQDAIGQGALELTRSGGSRLGGVIATASLPTANGLQITFTDYTFNGTTPGADGIAFFLTDASQPLPTHLGKAGGALGYEGTAANPGVPNAYVGIGLEEFGGFSSPNGEYVGGPGLVPQSFAVRGAAATQYQYIGGLTNGSGTPVSLPFALDAPASTTRPVNAPTVRATLTATGVLSVAIDHHDGNGFVLYYTQAIVGVAGQPAVPANVHFGLSAASGGDYELHQVSGLTVSALTTTVPPNSLLGETFENAASTGNLWQGFGDACLTAGTTLTPTTSLPACGATAPQDVAGQGALQLTQAGGSRSGGAIERTPLPTANGLRITFTDYTFNGTTPGADGLAMFLTDASAPFPTHIGKAGSALGYEGSSATSGVPNAWVGIGLEEYGGFSNPNNGEYVGGPGVVSQSVAVRGAAATKWQYIGGATNAAGVAAALPFVLDAPAAATRPAGAPTIQVTLTAAGVLGIAIDHHDGNGFLTFYSQAIVGVAGQPAVPANVYFGLSAATGGNYERHQAANLTITTLGTTAVIPAPDNNPPQIVSANGNLTFNVSAQANSTTGNPQFLYNGSAVPPTLRVLPGDTLVVNLVNNLPTPPAGAGYTDNLNLHYHGLHVSPQAPGDDSIDMLAAPGQSLHYSIQIPTNHPPGLYWYHTHVHGETERDTLAGMSGALIVDGIAAYTPQVASLTERVLIARDAPLAGTALPNANVAQSYAMHWAMQHGVTMHASRPGASTATSPAAGARSAEYHASTTMRANNPYAFVDPNYRRFVRSAAADTHCVAGAPEQPVHALTLNGQKQPALRIAPGEQQFWRVVNAGADTYLDFAVDNTQLQIIALDGVPLSAGTGTPASLTVGHWVIPPASRAEFIITGPPAGTAAFVRTNCFDSGQSGNPMPAAVLASINPTAAAANVKRNTAVGRISPKAVRFRFHTASTIVSANKLRSPSALRAATITATRTLFYSDQNNINGVAYNPAAPPMFYSQTGSVEQWTIQNNSYQVHTFHIHQVHFLVQAINGVTQAQQFLQDNVNVPAATANGPGSVTLLLDFTDPTIIGTFLLHCHILSHEDGGMMAKIRIGTAPPLTQSATAVTFASPTAGSQTVTLAGGTAPYAVSGCAGVAQASVNGNAVAILPSAAGACVLTVADSSVPSITTTIAVQVNGSAPIVTLTPVSVSFASPGAAAQNVTIAGGTAPYTVGGCANIASAAILGQTLAVTPIAAGTCSIVVTDANNNQATLSVAVNAVVTGNPLDNLTFHRNAQRTGWYQNETVLTTANVNATAFGQVATLAAPTGSPALGKVYAQPLFVTKETAVDGNVHNLVIVAGAADQIYAFDETTHAVVWHRDFTNTAAGIRQQLWSDSNCGDVNPDVGIIGTPVIDRTLDRLYVVVATMENGVPYTRLHAIGLGNGNDVVTPTVITGSVTLATGGTASISSLNNMNRSALLEANGSIYVSLGSHCDFQTSTTHGWEIAYDANTLQETGNLVDLTNANSGSGFFLGSIWMSGYGPAADAQGNIYFATGNGPFNGTTDFSMSVLKVPGNLNLAGATYFTPIQEAADSEADGDLGSGGVMLLPDQTGTIPHVIVAGGKCSYNTAIGCLKYLLNRDNLGGQQTANAGALWSGNTGGGIWGGPAYFVDSTGQQHIVYGSPISTYNLSTAPFGLTTQSSTTGVACFECRDNGSTPVVSSNGTQAGSAIVWALVTPGNGGGTISLYAFNAQAMGTTLFSAPAGTWTIGSGAGYIGGAMISPLIADGRVYVGTQNSVSVFGLLP